MLNCMRILSKFSLQSRGREAMVAAVRGAPGAVSALMKKFLDVCAAHLDHDALLVRTLFVLGNITAGSGGASDSNRVEIASAAVEGTAMDGLRLIVSIVARQVKALQSAAHFARESTEVVIKAIRVLANLSIAPDVGVRLARDDLLTDVLLQIISGGTGGGRDVDDSEHRNGQARTNHEELLVNVVSTISNYLSTARGTTRTLGVPVRSTGEPTMSATTYCACCPQQTVPKTWPSRSVASSATSPGPLFSALVCGTPGRIVPWCCS